MFDATSINARTRFVTKPAAVPHRLAKPSTFFEGRSLMHHSTPKLHERFPCFDDLRRRPKDFCVEQTGKRDVV